MSAQALTLAFAASIYPPAVAAVIALGRGADVRPRVFVFVLASLLVTYAIGALILYVLVEAGATGSRHLTPSAGVDIALGALLIALAVRLHLRRPSPVALLIARVRRRRHAEAGQPSADPGQGLRRQVQTGQNAQRPAHAGQGAQRPAQAEQDERRPAHAEQGQPSKIDRYLRSRRLAFTLGIVLYVLPSPIYIAAVKSVADANSSASAELVSLVVVVAIMLWMIELPMVLLLAFPARAVATLEAVNRWFARNGRTLAVLAALAVGLYMIVKGITQLS